MKLIIYTHDFYHANIDILDFIYKRYNTSSFRFDYKYLQGLSFDDDSRTILKSCQGIEIPFEQKVILEIYPNDDRVNYTYSNENIFIRRRYLEYQYSSLTLNEYDSNCLYFTVDRGISKYSTYNSIDIHIPDKGFGHYIQIDSHLVI